MNFTEYSVQRDQHRIYAREYAGEKPTIVLMHGFPDNLHLYDRLLPHLSLRHVVTFDFLQAAIHIPPKTKKGTWTP
jgi:haloalkane dehalogenase